MINKYFFKAPTYIVFLLVWTLINFYQAYSTGITGDEAYYVLFSEHLDWGFFDHPPMVAVFIWLGRIIFDGTLGVRLFAILSSTISIALLASMLEFRNRTSLLLFMVLVGALPFFSVYGFLMTPDVPLLLFASLFLWVARRYLVRFDWKYGLLLGVIMAALLYSKYHGILVILLFVLANPVLLGKASFYLSSILGFIWFMPHLWWQYQHGFATFTYHLSGHSANQWHWGFVGEYLLYPMIVLSPLLFYFIIRAMVKFKAVRPFERTLLYQFWGILVFFFLMAFKSHIEIHWIALVGLPVLIIVPAFYQNKEVAKTILKLGFLSSILMLVLRGMAMIPTIDEPYFHGSKAWAKTMEQHSEGNPVVFYGSYQWAALLAFYSDLETHSYNPYFYHNTQFDSWQKENELRHKKVFFVSKQPLRAGAPFGTSKGDFYGYWIPDYYSLQGLKIEILSKIDNANTQPSTPVIYTKISNPYDFSVDLLDKKYPLRFFYFYQNTEGNTSFIPADYTDSKHLIRPKGAITIKWQLPDMETGQYKVKLLFESPSHPLGMGSQEVEVVY